MSRLNKIIKLLPFLLIFPLTANFSVCENPTIPGPTAKEQVKLSDIPGTYRSHYGKGKTVLILRDDHTYRLINEKSKDETEAEEWNKWESSITDNYFEVTFYYKNDEFMPGKLIFDRAVGGNFRLRSHQFGDVYHKVKTTAR